MNSGIALVCPNCGIELTKEDQALSCPSCTRQWIIQKNVPWFSQSSPYWGEIEQSSMQELNRLAREKGWEYALGQIAPRLRTYVADPRRTEWTSLLPMQPDWIALDIGAGWGGNSFPLSHRIEHVVALESVYERAEFMEIRRRGEGRNNLQVVAASIHEMPLPRERFSLVVMNGILEWVAVSAKGDPGRIQETILRKVHDLLRVGGWIYIGIENRFSYHAFLGSQDHSGLPFTSLMPRKLADRYMRLFSGRHYRTYDAVNSYRTYTYSYWGYKRLLERCGFRDFQAWGTPSYNMPTRLYDLSNARGFKQLLYGASSASAKKKLLRLLDAIGVSSPVMKLFSPCFCIIARK